MNRHRADNGEVEIDTVVTRLYNITAIEMPSNPSWNRIIRSIKQWQHNYTSDNDSHSWYIQCEYTSRVCYTKHNEPYWIRTIMCDSVKPKIDIQCYSPPGKQWEFRFQGKLYCFAFSIVLMIARHSQPKHDLWIIIRADIGVFER